MTEKQDEKLSKALYLLTLIPVLMFGLLGGFFGFLDDNSTPVSGFLWGLGVGAAVLLACGIGMLGWEWVKKETNKGKMLPYLLVGFVVAGSISAYMAFSLGSPTCIDSTDADNRGSTCLEYADDGFEATSTQKWEKFWSTLPITVIISSLVAIIVRDRTHRREE